MSNLPRSLVFNYPEHCPKCKSGIIPVIPVTMSPMPDEAFFRCVNSECKHEFKIKLVRTSPTSHLILLAAENYPAGLVLLSGYSWEATKLDLESRFEAAGIKNYIILNYNELTKNGARWIEFIAQTNEIVEMATGSPVITSDEAKLDGVIPTSSPIQRMLEEANRANESGMRQGDLNNIELWKGTGQAGVKEPKSK